MKYRRAFVPGGSYFFTLVTVQRRPIIDNPDAIAVLRKAFSVVRSSRPFAIDAIVILPDHLHCIWTLPPDDADYPARWRLIKTWFTKHCDRRYLLSDDTLGTRKKSRPYGKIVIGNICYVIVKILKIMLSIFITIRVNMVWHQNQLNGLIRVFTGLLNETCIIVTGVVRKCYLKILDMNDYVGLRCANPTYELDYKYIITYALVFTSIFSTSDFL